MNLPKAETLILFAFLICIALWAMSKCSERRADAVRRVRTIEGSDAEDRPAKPDTVVVQAAPKISNETEVEDPAVPPVAHANPGPASSPKPGAVPKRPVLTNEISKPVAPVVSSSNSGSSSGNSTLFVTIDGLKVRKEPGLKGESVAELKLYEPVTFLNKKTEWTQEISLGYEKVKDHWVKVRTQSGKEGWVFGAGVHYYKMKRQGVLEEKKTTETPVKKKN